MLSRDWVKLAIGLVVLLLAYQSRMFHGLIVSLGAWAIILLPIGVLVWLYTRIPPRVPAQALRQRRKAEAQWLDNNPGKQTPKVENTYRRMSRSEYQERRSALQVSGYLNQQGRKAVSNANSELDPNSPETTMKRLELLATLPPCMIWSFNDKAAPPWSQALDGNPSLGPVSSAGANVFLGLNLSDRELAGLPRDTISKDTRRSGIHLLDPVNLMLFKVTPKVIDGLTQGPRRVEAVSATEHRTGKTWNLNVTCGVLNTGFAPAPMGPNGERGSSDWGTVDDLAGLGAVRRK